MSTETKLCCGPRFGVFTDGKCVTCGAPEDTESIPEIMDRQREEQEYLARFRAHRETFEQQAHSMRDVLKQMRFALNAFRDGCPELACEILGDALRTYGEEP